MGALGLRRTIRKVGNAASGIGDQGVKTLQGIQSDVGRIRKFLIEDAWPEANKTIIHFNKVLKDVETFLVIGTFTTKIFALLLAVCVLYICKSIIQQQQNTRPNLFSVLLEVFLYFIGTLCLLMAVALVLHILCEFFDISLPNSPIPFVIIIPSVTTVLVIIHYIKQLFAAVLTSCNFILHIMIWLPFYFFTDPVIRGSRYMHAISYLLTIPFVIIPFATLYSASMYFLFCVYLEIFEKPVKEERENHDSGFTLLETIFISYAIFYVTAILTYILGGVLIESFIRRLWAYFAMRNLNQ